MSLTQSQALLRNTSGKLLTHLVTLWLFDFGEVRYEGAVWLSRDGLMIKTATGSRNKPSVATILNFTSGHISAADLYLYQV